MIFLSCISDCLDNGNNKKAIQEADKVLKKQKDLQCAKVYSVDLSIKSSVAELY